jgi:NAD(P)H dehydrogenase (quinone)
MAAVAPDNKPKIAIVFHSTYGHVRKLADKIAESINASGGEATLLQVPETLSAEVLQKMYAAPRDTSIAEANASDLPNYDGILFGIPTRFGMASAQMKAFWDTTGGLWASGALVGKPAGTFFSTSSQGGGQESTALTWVTQLAHHGMIYVPMGFTNKAMFSLDEVHGGSAYGPGTFAGGDGSRQPSELELSVCTSYGAQFCGTVAALKKGRA